MKRQEVVRLIQKNQGFYVLFFHRVDGYLQPDRFPEEDEEAFMSYEEASNIARAFAQVSADYVNIQVCRSMTHKPLQGCEEVLNQFPARAK